MQWVTDHFYAVAVVGGPILLGAALLYAVLRNRTTPRQDRQTEEGTKQVYAEAKAEERARGGDT